MQPQRRTLNALPVFPLPDFYLFPGTVAPLHIFENRYRQMMEDLMDGPGRLVLVPYPSETPLGPSGPVLPEIGTLAEVVQHEKLEDGRWVTLLLALDRVAVKEAESDRMYRKVWAEILPEPQEDTPAGQIIREELLTALRQRTTGDWEVPQSPTIGRLADVLLHALNLNPAQMKESYLERDPVARAARALAWHQLAGLESEESEED
jgi:Lon protease-like protein